MINFLHEIPSYIQQQTIGEIMGVFSYVQTFVLIETLFIFVVTVIIAYLLPRSVILKNFLSQASLLVIITSLWALPIHFQDRIISKLSLDLSGYLIFLSLLIISYIVVLISSSILLRRNSNFEAGFLSIINKIVTLSIIYLSIDLAGILVIISRIIIQVYQ